MFNPIYQQVIKDATKDMFRLQNKFFVGGNWWICLYLFLEYHKHFFYKYSKSHLQILCIHWYWTTSFRKLFRVRLLDVIRYWKVLFGILIPSLRNQNYDLFYLCMIFIMHYGFEASRTSYLKDRPRMQLELNFFFRIFIPTLCALQEKKLGPLLFMPCIKLVMAVKLSETLLWTVVPGYSTILISPRGFSSQH